MDYLRHAEMILSSSSSSSSSSDDEFYVQYLLAEYKQNQRVQKFMETINNYNEEEFRSNFRIKRETANTLIAKYEVSEYFRKKVCSGGKKEIPAETQILVFLWFAGNKDSYREVAKLFNIAISTTYTIISDILEFIFKESPNYIRFFSTEEEKQRAAMKFKQIAGFPDTLGCIDGCYIYIRKPTNKVRSTYTNRHDLISLTLQGICDADQRFIDVFVGASSKIHDARIFELSFIRNDLPTICGSKYHILGDAAYPLREYLMTPYKNINNLTQKKKKYNKKHSQTRVKIENAFGSIKTRFRQLLIRLDFHSVERMCKFILACCVLHNMCIDDGDTWTEEQIEPEDNTENANENFIETNSETNSQRLGEIKRNIISDQF